MHLKTKQKLGKQKAESRSAGYAEDLLAAGRADPDEAHWLIGLAALREVWAKQVTGELGRFIEQSRVENSKGARKYAAFQNKF